MSTLVAEELDADWGQMRAELRPPTAPNYKNLFFGIQGTGGSTVDGEFLRAIRKAGAVARAMLVAAAAAAWEVPAAEIVVDAGVMSHKSGRKGAFGEFADAAAKLDVPEASPLKAPRDFTLIGKAGHRARHARRRSSGKPHLHAWTFTSTAWWSPRSSHPPRFGATVDEFDASKAAKVDGFLDAKIIPQGVAVYAKSTWPAFKAASLVEVTWDDSEAEKRGSAELLAEYRGLPARRAPSPPISATPTRRWRRRLR